MEGEDDRRDWNRRRSKRDTAEKSRRIAASRQHTRPSGPLYEVKPEASSSRRCEEWLCRPGVRCQLGEVDRPEKATDADLSAWICK